MSKKIRLTVLMSAVTLIVIVAVTYFLNSKFHFFADEVSDPLCRVGHEYQVVTGEQQNTALPGLPKNLLVRISRDEVKAEFGEYADNKTIVCKKSSTGALSQIPSFIESGEIFFQLPDDIPQKAKETFYMASIVDASQRVNLVADSDIEIHKFSDQQYFNEPSNPSRSANFWRTHYIELMDAPGTYHYPTITKTDVMSPGGNDTILYDGFETGKVTDPAKHHYSNFLYSWPFESTVDPSLKGKYLLNLGWVKYDVDKQDVPNDKQSAAVSRSIKQEIASDGSVANDNSVSTIKVVISANADWDRYYDPMIFSADKEMKSGFQGWVKNLTADSKIYYSSFKFIKNIVAPVQHTGWVNNSSMFFGKGIIQPQKITSTLGAPFVVDSSTKLFLTDDYANYYKDHYDENKLIITDKLEQTVRSKYDFDLNPDEIKNYKGGKAIFIGDTTNQDFMNMAAKLRSNISTAQIQDEGFNIFVSDKYILAIGKDMVGSYYASLRIADLIKSNYEINQRIEEDWSQSKFRSIYSYVAITQPLEEIKLEMKRLSELRNNFYEYNFYFDGPGENNSFVNVSSDEEYNASKLGQAIAYSRKYFMEPVVGLFNFRNNFSSRTAHNHIWKTDKVEIPVANADSFQFADYVLSTYEDDTEAVTPIPIIVKDANNQLLSSPSQYTISDNKITLLDQSITKTDDGSKYVINITSNRYNKDNMGHVDEGAGTRLNSVAARQLTKANIEKAILYAKPKFFNLNLDEVKRVGADYRDLYHSNGVPKKLDAEGNPTADPAELFADLVNFMYETINPSGLPKRAEVMMWEDMVNKEDRYGQNYSFNKPPYTFGAIDKIPKDIILDVWWHGNLGSSSGCQAFSSSTQYLLDKGFRVIMSPLVESSRSFFECQSNVQKNNPTQFVGFKVNQWSDYNNMPQADIVSSRIWNLVPTSLTSDIRNIHSINFSNGQIIKTNPYMLSVKVKDATKVEKVEFYIDDVLIGTATLPDVNGVYDWPWDTSKYHSIVKIVVYGTDGQTEEVTRNTTVDLSGGQESTNSIVAVLPKTGESVLKSKILDMWDKVKKLIIRNN